MKRFLAALAVTCTVMQSGLSARPAVVNPLYWDDAFVNAAVRDTVEYVYFTLAPESATDTVLTGDTLFVGDVGRPDLLVGDQALDVMEKSELVLESLGEHIFEWFLRNKRREWSEYQSQVTGWELDRYLRTW